MGDDDGRRWRCNLREPDAPRPDRDRAIADHPAIVLGDQPGAVERGPLEIRPAGARSDPRQRLSIKHRPICSALAVGPGGGIGDRAAIDGADRIPAFVRASRWDPMVVVGVTRADGFEPAGNWAHAADPVALLATCRLFCSASW